MMYRQALVLALLLLTSCASNKQAEEAEKKHDKAEQAEAAAAEASIDDARCQGFGYRRYSAAYVQCRKDYQSLHKSLGINAD
jgi:hypothetical protein